MFALERWEHLTLMLYWVDPRMHLNFVSQDLGYFFIRLVFVITDRTAEKQGRVKWPLSNGFFFLI